VVDLWIHLIRTAASHPHNRRDAPHSPPPRRSLIPFRDDPRYHTPQWRALRTRAIALYGRRCSEPGCTKDMTLPGMTHVDHIVPPQDGGDFWAITNLQILCKPHHFAKGLGDAATKLEPVSPNA
jgi:5-methylcytosine-specific restriction endonuclease McrA